MALNYGVNIMSDDTIFETVGEKAQAIYDATKADETCMIHVPYPIGWISGIKVEQVRIPTNRLDDVEVKRTSITEQLSFEVKEND